MFTLHGTGTGINLLTRVNSQGYGNENYLMGVEENGSIKAFPLSSNSNGLAGQSRRVVIRSYSGTDVITGAN